VSGLGVAILAGGMGMRLRDVTGPEPKALAPLAGRSLLDWQLERVASLRPDRVVVLACYGADRVKAAVAGRAEVLVEDEPLGTAGGLARLPDGPDRWLSLNVDHVSDVPLDAFVAAFRPPCTACLWQTSVPVDEGVVDVDGDRLVAWRERPVLRLPVTTGLYVFSARALRVHLDGGRRDMPALVQALMPEGVTGWTHRGTWIDAGTPSRLARASAWLSAPIETVG
jgi:NDP-mannose synthase